MLHCHNNRLWCATWYANADKYEAQKSTELPQSGWKQLPSFHKQCEDEDKLWQLWKLFGVLKKGKANQKRLSNLHKDELLCWELAVTWWILHTWWHLLLLRSDQMYRVEHCHHGNMKDNQSSIIPSPLCWFCCGKLRHERAKEKRRKKRKRKSEF